VGAQQYILRRLLHAVPVLFFVSVIVFLVLHLSPGDPAVQMYGAQPGVTKDMIEAARHQMGLDKPWIEQYLFWIGNLLRGDMGESYVNHLPVSTVVGQKLPASIELAVASLALAVLVAVPGGIIAAVKHGSRIESLLTAFITLGIAIPSFWLGIIMVLVFAVALGLVPPSGYVAIEENPGQNLRFLILPATTMAILVAAPIMRFLRSSMLDVLNDDYIRTAHAKGLTTRGVVVRHALKNALIPTVTVLGLQFAGLVGSAVMVEWIFGWPGIGWLAINAIFQRDYLLVQGTLVIVAATFVLVNLVVDLLYAAIDPRIRYE
jgi:peptide/nickel transport system permease protein